MYFKTIMPEIINSYVLNNHFMCLFTARMFEPRTGRVLGQAVLEPTQNFSYFCRQSTPVSSLAIVNLRAYVRNQGVGTDLLNFSRNQSYEKGCNGRMHLISSDCYDEDFPPHVFYRKYGFTSFETEKLNSIDSQILTGNPEYFYFEDIAMFYTPKEAKNKIPKGKLPEKTKSSVQRFKDSIKTFFSV